MEQHLNLFTLRPPQRHFDQPWMFVSVGGSVGWNTLPPVLCVTVLVLCSSNWFTMLHLYTLSILCTLFLISNALANGEYWGYFKWTDEQNPNRTNLYCPNGCKESNHLNGCCLCSAVPLWELNQMKVTNLNLEYIDRRGHAVLLLPNPSEINRIPTFTRITYSNGFLAFMPINLCSFPDVVAIDLSHNLL